MLEAIFNETINTVKVSGLTQWDYGRTLHIKGIEAPVVTQVHFCNASNPEAIVRLAKVEGDAIVVDIPNVLLHDNHDIKCWLFVVGENKGFTLKTVWLDVVKRTKPQDFVSPPDPSEQELLEDFIIQINKDTEEMKNALNECIEDNAQFKEDMELAFDEYYRQLREESLKKTNLAMDVFVDPNNWVDGVYTIDISEMELNEKARIQLNVEDSETNKENASVIIGKKREGNTYKLFANSNPTEPILITLVYSGEVKEGTPFVDEFIGTKTITWTEKVERKDESIYLLFNDYQSNSEIGTDKSSFEKGKVLSANSSYGSLVLENNGIFNGKPCMKYVDGTSYTSGRADFLLFNKNTISVDTPIQIHLIIKTPPTMPTSGNTIFGRIYEKGMYSQLGLVYDTSTKNFRCEYSIKSGADSVDTGIKCQPNTVYDICLQWQNQYAGGHGKIYLDGQLIFDKSLYGVMLVSDSDAIRFDITAYRTYLLFDELMVKVGFDDSMATHRHSQDTERFKAKWIEEIEHSKEITVSETSYMKVENGELFKWCEIVPAPSFELDSNTITLLHGEDITNATGKGNITNNGVVASYDLFMSGEKSLYFDGSSYMQINNAGVDSTFMSGNFTIEWWEYYKSAPESYKPLFRVGYCDNGFGSIMVRYGGTGFYVGNNSGSSWNIINQPSFFQVETNKWIHWAIVRQGDSWKIYKNGKLNWSGTSSVAGANPYTENTLTFQRMQGTTLGGHNCYIDEFRISNIARYNGEFETVKQDKWKWVKQ